MPESTNPKPKLNIFALPNQTTILFGLIVVTLLGVVLAGTVGLAPFPTWPLALALLFLPLRAFLARPERDFARYNLVPAGDDLADLQQVIADLSREIGLRRVPHLLVSLGEQPKQPYTFGTFRHWYIAISHAEALALQKQLNEPTAPVTEAKLIHELYHFKTGDYWQLGYVRELLRLTAWFMAWAFLFFLGYGLLLLVAGLTVLQTDPAEWLNQIEGLTPEMRQALAQLLPSPAELEGVRQEAESLNLGVVINFAISAVLPYIVVGFLLWRLVWPKLWRTREFYADAGVAHTQGQTRPLLSARTNIPLPFLKNYTWPENNPQKSVTFRAKMTAWRKTLSRLTRTHPPTIARLTAIAHPVRVFDTWLKTALLVGGFALLLDIVSVSSLTLFYVGSWPMHFPTLVILLVVSLNLIPSLIATQKKDDQSQAEKPSAKTSNRELGLGRSASFYMLKIVAVVMSLRLVQIVAAIALLIFFFITSPALLAQMLTTGAAATAGFSRRMTPEEADNLAFKAEDVAIFVVEGAILNLAQVFIIFVILIAALGLIIFLLRRLFTWYGFPHAERRLMRVAYAVIGLTTVFVGLTVLPLATTALLQPSELLDFSGIIVGAIGLLVAVIGLGWFIVTDRRYARRCPACGECVSGLYYLGKQCNCGQRLHPWLIAEYDL